MAHRPALRPSAPRSAAVPLLAVLLLLMGMQAHATPLAQGAEPPPVLVLQLRWDHQFQFAGYYAAQWEGYFAEEGLQVEIRSAFFPECKLCEATEEVASGRAHFGVGAGDILLARSKGAPLQVVSSIFQQSATEIFAREGTKLDGPADLLNLRISRQVNSMLDMEMQAMLRAEGLDPRKLDTLALTGNNALPRFLSGEVQVLTGTSLATPFVLGEEGVRLVSLRPAAYGVDFYGDALFTHASLAEQQPDLVSGFQRAVHRGWRFALENPGALSLRITDSLPRDTAIIPKEKLYDFNMFQARKIASLMFLPYVEVGHVNVERWRRMQSFLEENGAITRGGTRAPLVFDPNQQLAAENRWIIHLLQGTAVVLAALGLLVFTWAFTLRRTVAARTQDLAQTNADLRRVIADLEAAQGALRANATDLARSNAELEQFAYVASHDLQEPLRKLTAFSAMLREDLQGQLTEEVGKDLHYITDAAQRMQRLVEDLLTFSRTGREAFEARRIPLEGCVRQVLSSLDLRIRESGAQVRIDPLPDILGDPTLVTQLYQNLISNALKFVPAGTVPEVHLTAETGPEGWVLGVRDNGIGIKPAYQEQVFAPFKRLHSRGVYDGTGIGLAICRRAVERHGGRIWVESVPDQGSHFKFTLPIAEPGS